MESAGRAGFRYTTPYIWALLQKKTRLTRAGGRSQPCRFAMQPAQRVSKTQLGRLLPRICQRPRAEVATSKARCSIARPFSSPFPTRCLLRRSTPLPRYPVHPRGDIRVHRIWSSRQIRVQLSPPAPGGGGVCGNSSTGWDRRLPGTVGLSTLLPLLQLAAHVLHSAYIYWLSQSRNISLCGQYVGWRI